MTRCRSQIVYVRLNKSQHVRTCDVLGCDAVVTEQLPRACRAAQMLAVCTSFKCFFLGFVFRFLCPARSAARGDVCGGDDSSRPTPPLSRRLSPTPPLLRRLSPRWQQPQILTRRVTVPASACRINVWPGGARRATAQRAQRRRSVRRVIATTACARGGRM